MIIDALNLDFRELNEKVRNTGDSLVEIINLAGQRYIAAGSSGRVFHLYGVPGNALGCFLDGSEIEVFADAEDEVGDTMNDGRIIIHGSVSDACGYAMRGGRIYIEGNAGYRTGIHMKAYKEKQPLIIIGGRAGSFLGEYLAGGTIVVLGIGNEGRPPVGYFTGTGMHGGRIILRSDTLPRDLPAQVMYKSADEEDKKEIASLIEEYAGLFDIDMEEILEGNFFILTPNSTRPYKRLYTNI